jgi:DNA polymerase-3 subunit epsilon
LLDWLKNINKEHPEFWKNYVSKFDKKSTRFVVLSTKLGMNVEKDVILSIGSFAVIDNSIVIGDSFEAVLQYKFLHDNGLSMIFVESKMKN